MYPLLESLSRLRREGEGELILIDVNKISNEMPLTKI
jgi:hypothetical protein